MSVRSSGWSCSCRTKYARLARLAKGAEEISGLADQVMMATEWATTATTRAITITIQQYPDSPAH
eukprot:4640315-Prymnesium_polylepis.1